MGAGQVVLNLCSCKFTLTTKGRTVVDNTVLRVSTPSQNHHGAMCASRKLYPLLLLLVSSYMLAEDQNYLIATDPSAKRAELKIANTDKAYVLDDNLSFPGESRVWTVLLKNDSGAQMKIVSASVSCSCTTIDMEKNIVLAPGTEAMARISIDLPNRHGDFSTGVQFVANRIEGEVISELVTNIEYKVRISDYLTLDEGGSFVRIGAFSSHSPASFVVKRGSHPDAWNKLTAHSEDPFVSLRVLRLEAETWKIELLPNPEAPKGAYSVPVRFSFANDGVNLPREIKMLAVGVNMGPVRCVPGEIYLGPTKSSQKHDQIELQLIPDKRWEDRARQDAGTTLSYKVNKIEVGPISFGAGVTTRPEQADVFPVIAVDDAFSRTGKGNLTFQMPVLTAPVKGLASGQLILHVDIVEDGTGRAVERTIIRVKYVGLL
jgi:hypothetical protein